MGTKYANLAELVAAIRAGDVDGDHIRCLVDNDSVSFDDEDAEEELLDMDPSDLTIEALGLLGIRAERP